MNAIQPASNPPHRLAVGGLTLLELLVVVSILAVLATVTMRHLTAIGEQSQYDLNEAMCRDFRRALVGTPSSVQSDGSAAISGFIADLGRPPRSELEAYVVGEAEADGTGSSALAYTLRELVSQRFSPQFGIYNTDSNSVTATSFNAGAANILLYDSTNSVATGWRGPYMQGGNDDIIDDGWGKPLAAYSPIGARSLVNFWIATYEATTSVPKMSPFTGISLSGYSDLGSGVGHFPWEVVGVMVRPGAASMAVLYGASTVAAASNKVSAGIVWTNEYIAQLLCNLSFNTNSIADANLTNPTLIANYYFLCGVIMYGPNPFYNSAATTVTHATSRPVGVAYRASGAAISGDGITLGASVDYPNSTDLTFVNYPCKFATGGPMGPGYDCPLVMGPRVVKPFLVAKRMSSVASGTDVVVYAGTARSIVLRPGFNSVQLVLP